MDFASCDDMARVGHRELGTSSWTGHLELGTRVDPMLGTWSWTPGDGHPELALGTSSWAGQCELGTSSWALEELGTASWALRVGLSIASWAASLHPLLLKDMDFACSDDTTPLAWQGDT